MSTTDTRSMPAGTDPGPGGTLLRVEGLGKHFGATIALREAALEVRAGEIHALVGENGSGKSTLVKILSGVHRPTAGRVVLGGAAHDGFPSPRAAQDAGIVTVFQEVLSVGSRTVLDNLWLGTDGVFATGTSRRERERRARQVLAELLESPPPLDALLEDLTLSERQVCSIARALLRSPRVLILDEATSALDYDSRTRLFAAVKRLRDAGSGVILITHRMDEIEEIGDRVTVLRSGVTVGTIDDRSWTTPQLVEMMTGGENLTRTDRPARRTAAADAPVVLRADGLVLAPDREPVSVEIRAGELVGLAGLEGQGQDAFLRALAGYGSLGGRVVSVASGRERELASREAAHRERVAYVPRERRGESLFEWMSILDNFAVPTIHRDARAGLVRPAATARRLAGYVASLRMKIGRPGDAITTLSGGNQQKVVIARWLATEPRVLLLNDPTRGIDINAKRDLYALLERLTEEGMAVVMLSTEVDEHVELMDRVLVFADFACTARLDRGELTRSALVSSFFRHDGAADGAARTGGAP